MTSMFLKTVLPSGLVVLSERMPDRLSVSVGVWLRNGARDEPSEWLGISHFIEHMMFKGTAGRDARAIAQSLESVGGHLDAFTGREQVCYYARALSEHVGANLNDFKQPNAILRDLKAAESILAAAEAAGVRFHFTKGST